MNIKIRQILFFALIGGAIFALSWPGTSGLAQEPSTVGTIYGRVIDSQDQPVRDAHIHWLIEDVEQSVVETSTQDDGSFTLALPETIIYSDPESELGEITLKSEDYLNDSLVLNIERPHFQSAEIEIESSYVEALKTGGSISLSDTTLIRRISPAFWIATAIFVFVLILIVTGKLHNTLAALLGASLIYAISYLGHPIYEDLYIFDFNTSLDYIDWNVIFLIMGMMIVIAVIERTGIFQWLAFFAYRISKGRVLILLPILMIITGVASAFLDNVTTMLLMTPISIQIAIAMGINPLAFLLPEVMASNVMGISTLIGTPTNILIGSYGDLSFNDFLVNLTPGVALSIIGLVIYSNIIYRKDLAAAHTTSPFLMEQLAARGKITEPEHLKKAGWIGLGMLLLFMFGEKVHLLPAVTALIGATALMVWIKPDIEEMIEAVDWTTLVFFMALFITVGAIQEVGLISLIADFIGNLVGKNLTLAMLVVIWFSAVLSTVVANIPFTAAMLPVIGYLTATIPGAHTKVLFYCLSVGSALGGNGSLIGASANMVTSGISERAGYPISYLYFLRKGFPALLITVGLSTLWLLIRF